jgi:hypothetical protein
MLTLDVDRETQALPVLLTGFGVTFLVCLVDNITVLFKDGNET